MDRGSLPRFQGFRHDSPNNRSLRTLSRPSTSWQLLSCIAWVTGARDLIGFHAKTFQPHCRWFLSPEDEALGSLRTWPVDVCAAPRRSPAGRKDSGAAPSVWPSDLSVDPVPRLTELDKASAEDFKSLADFRAQLFARLLFARLP